MQVLPHYISLNKIQKQDLPLRVTEEIFPIFETTIKKEYTIAIGVSSGIDSMTLITLIIIRHYLKKYPLNHIHIIHCNHHIRKQSDEEQTFIQTFFKGLHIHTFKKDKKLKTDEKTLRQRRYQCFENITQQENIPFLFLGHHLEDRIESSFLNLMR